MDSLTKDAAIQKITQLVERFNEQKEFYKKTDYNETLTRRDFIDPFFKALGWDVDNEQGYSESYREVIHEDKIKIGSATKAPDYSFRLGGGKRLFFVEAKKPSVLIKEEIDPAYQVRRYGWSAKLPISIITDFEEFAIYDCTKKPNLTDKASNARIKYLTYNNYLNEFDFIWDTFSKEKVLKGSFDKFVQSDKQKKGTTTVDHEFLQSLDNWRTYLATSIAVNNKHLNEDELNFVVQQTIDRIIFLRIAEDRNVEPYGNLQDTIKNGDYYKNMLRQFHIADQKYNSGLFDFKKDKISDHITIDNKVVKTVINDLYYPISPYEFSVLSVEILGSAYEQFLGKQISLSKSGRAVIQEKPEVRKAGGVYYTPQYIVDYIVKNTVGKLVENKTSKDISKIKIVDPACGSGSFLIGAYQYLLDYHKDYYSDHGKRSKGNKDNPLTPDGSLTTAEKKRILLNNIYGVDLDANAVEVTKLSLLLKCMEGETEASIKQLRLFHERILPTLDYNIKSGNSLIDVDFYNTEFDFGEDRKIKPFNWQKGFPEIFKQGGFDCVVGNPPYIQMAMFDWFDDIQKRYLLEKYCSSMGRMNTFGFFIEQGINLIRKGGKLGYIIPNTILTQEYYQELRDFILGQAHIDDIVSYEKFVFSDAVVETATLILTKGKINSKSKVSFYDKEGKYTFKSVNQESFKSNYKSQFSVTFGESDAIVRTKIHNKTTLTFNDVCFINQAIALKSDRAAYLFDKQLGKNYKPVLDGREIQRYQTNWAGKYLKYDINAIHSCKREDIFTSKEKIFFRRVSSSLIGTLDIKQFYALNTLIAVNKKENVECSIKFILAVFNSKLINYYYSKFLKSTKKVFSEIQARQIGQIPFPSLSLKNVNDKLRHDDIVKNVDQLLELNEELQETKLQSKIDQLQGRIGFCDHRINEIVYQLYGLNREEIAIVESS